MRWAWKSAALGITPRHDLPSGWKVTRVGDLAHLINGHPYDSKFFGEEGAPLIRIRDILGGSTQTRYSGAPLTSRRVQYGDLLIGMDGDFNTGRWKHSEPGLLNQRVLAVEASSEISAWIGYCLPEPLAIINDLKYSTTVKHLTTKDVASIRIPLPRNTDLHKLLQFLDRETAEIDAFITDQERLIKLLEERRAATITHAVTKGLDPTVPMKDSGIDWLGTTQIPATWRSWKMNHLLRLQSGESLTSQSIEESGVYPVYGGGGFRGYTATYTNDGDHALIGRQGALCGNIKRATGKFFATEHAIVVYPLHELNTVWLTAILQTMNLGQYSQSAAQPGISVEVISQKKLPVPPLPEQHAIADFLDRELSGIDAAVSDAREAIALSRERRAALISAAVTGQVDVTQMSAGEVLEEEVRV